MKSFTWRQFRELYASLPDQVQGQTRRAYQLFRRNPSHPGLNFKKVDEGNNIYSARVGLSYRALGQMDGSDIVWFWIGPRFGIRQDRLSLNALAGSGDTISAWNRQIAPSSSTIRL